MFGLAKKPAPAVKLASVDATPAGEAAHLTLVLEVANGNRSLAAGHVAALTGLVNAVRDLVGTDDDVRQAFELDAVLRQWQRRARDLSHNLGVWNTKVSAAADPKARRQAVEQRDATGRDLRTAEEEVTAAAERATGEIRHRAHERLDKLLADERAAASKRAGELGPVNHQLDHAAALELASAVGSMTALDQWNARDLFAHVAGVLASEELAHRQTEPAAELAVA